MRRVTLTGKSITEQSALATIPLVVFTLKMVLPFRKNYAGIGYTYDEERDAFIPPQPYASWTLNEDTCLWDSPVPYPSEGVHEWDEDNQEWVESSWTN